MFQEGVGTHPGKVNKSCLQSSSKIETDLLPVVAKIFKQIFEHIKNCKVNL